MKNIKKKTIMHRKISYDKGTGFTEPFVSFITESNSLVIQTKLFTGTTNNHVPGVEREVRYD